MIKHGFKEVNPFQCKLFLNATTIEENVSGFEIATRQVRG